MPARGMSADDQRLPEPRQRTGHRPHLADDLSDRDIGTQVIAWDRNTDPMGIQAAGEVAEKGTVQRLPVTAMNEHDDRARVIGGEKINGVARPGTVGDRARGMLFAIGGRVARPSGDICEMLRLCRKYSALSRSPTTASRLPCAGTFHKSGLAARAVASSRCSALLMDVLTSGFRSNKPEMP